MKNLFITSLILLLCSCESQSPNRSEPTTKVVTFPLSQVELISGPFQQATELNQKSLLNYEPDRLLANFRKSAGLEPRAEHYGGWEGETISGHSLGHYLSGCALMFASTGDQRFKERVDYIVEELRACQLADGSGFIGAFPDGKRILEEEVAVGNIRSQGFDLNGIWVPWYNEHKTLAGLRDAYRLCNNQTALLIAQELSDWIYTIVVDLTEEQTQTMLACEFGGIQETFADLYGDTGNEKYLQLARKFHHQDIIDPLANGQDILPGKHGNTQIPKLIGYARLYELTDQSTDSAAAQFFWQTVVNHHSYVTGGHGNHEYFGEPDQLNYRLSDGTTETCNVYNMLKLSEHLFSWQPDAAVADYYERALFNHILASQHPVTGQVIYNLSLEMGGKKEYQNPEWFTCCVGTGMETHSKYGKNIYYKNESSLYVSQFIASRLDWVAKNVKVLQTTSFPEESSSVLSFSMPQPTDFELYIRYPLWAQSDFNITVNEEVIAIKSSPGSFIKISREWQNGDEVRIEMPFHLRMETMPDNPDRIAIFNGPVLLAGDLGPDSLPMSYKPGFVPVIMSESRDPNDWLLPQPVPHHFQSVGVGHPRQINFKPFFQTHDRRYSVYFDLFTADKWKQYQEEYEANLRKEKELIAVTYDFFQPGEMQSERDHHFQGDSLTVMDFRNKKARMAHRGGWFTFDMKVLDKDPTDLIISYWGGFTGSKTFDIQVDGETIATENISGKADGKFIQVTYPIPIELTAGKSKVTVKFAPHVGHRAGPIFGARTVKRNAIAL